MRELKDKIRTIKDFPKEGISYQDITPLLKDPKALNEVMRYFSIRFKGRKIDKVVGIDARGFLLASTMAYILGSGVSIVRKKGKLPYKTRFATYEKEYGPDTIEMHEDTIKPGEKVIIVDDLIATGGTMLATVDLVKQLGGDIIGIDFIVNLTFLPGEKLLKEKGYNIHYLIDYDNEEIK